jgi:hypothetical protein
METRQEPFRQGLYGCAMTMGQQRIASLQGQPGVVARAAGRHRELPRPGMPQLQVDMIL